MLNIFKKEESNTAVVKYIKFLTTAIALSVVGLILLSFYRKTAFFSVDSSTYQAIFLSNDQVYFGKLKTSIIGMPYITDVYYLSGDRNISDANTASDSVNLVKLGGEVHGPEDYIYMNQSSIVFWENLKQDSVVVKNIENKN